jgi:hypothetical protein
MGNKSLRLMAAVVYGTLSACATEPISSDAATPVTAENRLLYLHESADTVPITIVRDQGVLGGMFAVKLLVNDAVAAHVGNGEKVTLHMPPGEYVLGAVMGFSPLVEIEANVQQGRPRSYRIGIHPNGVSLSRTVER